MKDDDILYVLPSAAVSLFSTASKSIQQSLFASRNNVIACHAHGLYHITSDEAADKIIASKEIHASSRFDSYGIHKRCFFFGGIPDFENVCLNVEPSVTLTAVVLNLPYEKLAEFDYRSKNDGAISYKGDLSLEGLNVQKVRLGLKEYNGELRYERISEEEFQNYKLSVSEKNSKIIKNNLAFKIRGYLAGMRKEYEMFKNRVSSITHKLIHDQSSGFSLDTLLNGNMEDNSDLFEHTDEIPVAEIILQDQAINLYNSLIDNNSQSFNLGNFVYEDKNDVKAELLKAVVSSVRTSLDEGIPIDSSDTTIKPGMNEKKVADVLYTNLSQGNIDECYKLLDNSVVLFSVCQTYVKNNKRIRENDPVVQFLNSEINGFNSNLKQESMGQISF